MKECTKCGETKELSEFSKHKRGPDGLRTICRQCHYAYNKKWYNDNKETVKEYEKNWRKTNKEAAQNKALKFKYGISLEDYNKMEQQQQYRCACCGSHVSEVYKNKLFVDHCHDTGKVRSLLCNRCNVAIGLAKEDIDILASMIAYIKEHKHDT